MRRRDFSRSAALAGVAALAATAVGLTRRTQSSELAPAVDSRPPRAASAPVALGTNLSGMEWAESGLRYGASSMPHINFSVPRAAEVLYLARNGYTKTRLPIKWELLQPMLHDTAAAPAAIAAIGRPGAFHSGYAAYITGVLDAHAAVGIKCIIDCHNYCRYRDFKYQPDGSVTGLVVPSSPLVRPYTSDNQQVQTRIFALAPGATLKQSHFIDFWTRAAARWKDHPGFGGYGLMNEPHDMPRPGEIVESEGGGEDLTIWPAYAQAAVKAIREIDAVNPIYVSGNGWSSAMSIADNPGFPLSGANLIYEVHLYLDALSNGHAFDWDTEAARKFSAGLGNVSIDRDTGVKRLKPAVDWARSKGLRLALTEIGMPLDDDRWQESFARTVNFARQNGVEVYSWMGGNHWPIRNYAINHVPGWHQNRTLEPLVSGPLKASAGIAQAALFDDGPGWAPAGGSVTITVYARGHLAEPQKLTVRSGGAGRLSKSTLVIPAGPNGQDSFIFTPARNAVTTLSYERTGGGLAPPPPRKVYSLSDPVAYAATSLPDAAMAIIAKYGACKWELSDGYTDYVQGTPATAGQVVRAVSDSGFGSSPGNAMEMLNWVNTDSRSMGPMVPPVMRVTRGRKHSDHSAPDTWGFWCRKSLAVPAVQPNPRNRVPYGTHDAHFAIAAVSLRSQNGGGVVFQASNARESHSSDLGFVDGRPQAKWTDASGTQVELAGAARLPPNTPAVVSFTCAAGAQTLRVNSAVAATGTGSLAAGGYDQFLIGWGFVNYYPRENFAGSIYAVITGKGVPTSDEMAVLERYLASTAGIGK
jgi:endoglucanase